ncbi:hypothetical protein BDV97DRAFT_355027 [Delphinella strobiligena]|nr:hypothetical protein BDV97DRAFT_355027 [Delphinella strobiligena]
MDDSFDFHALYTGTSLKEGVEQALLWSIEMLTKEREKKLRGSGFQDGSAEAWTRMITVMEKALADLPLTFGDDQLNQLLDQAQRNAVPSIANGPHRWKHSSSRTLRGRVLQEPSRRSRRRSTLMRRRVLTERSIRLSTGVRKRHKRESTELRLERVESEAHKLCSLLELMMF